MIKRPRNKDTLNKQIFIKLSNNYSASNCLLDLERSALVNTPLAIATFRCTSNKVPHAGWFGDKDRNRFKINVSQHKLSFTLQVWYMYVYTILITSIWQILKHLTRRANSRKRSFNTKLFKLFICSFCMYPTSKIKR